MNRVIRQWEITEREDGRIEVVFNPKGRIGTGEQELAEPNYIYQGRNLDEAHMAVKRSASVMASSIPVPVFTESNELVCQTWFEREKRFVDYASIKDADDLKHALRLCDNRLNGAMRIVDGMGRGKVVWPESEMKGGAQ